MFHGEFRVRVWPVGLDRGSQSRKRSRRKSRKGSGWNVLYHRERTPGSEAGDQMIRRCPSDLIYKIVKMKL
jgi:hypothetical protein